MEKVSTWAIDMVLGVYGAVLAVLFRVVGRKMDREECKTNQDRCPLISKWDEFEKNQDKRWEDLKNWMIRFEERFNKHLERHQ